MEEAEGHGNTRRLKPHNKKNGARVFPPSGGHSQEDSGRADAGWGHPNAGVGGGDANRGDAGKGYADAGRGGDDANTGGGEAGVGGGDTNRGDANAGRGGGNADRGTGDAGKGGDDDGRGGGDAGRGVGNAGRSSGDTGRGGRGAGRGGGDARRGGGGAGRGGGDAGRGGVRYLPTQGLLAHEAFRGLYIDALAKKQYITTSKLLEGSDFRITQVNSSPLFKYINKVNLIVEKVFFYYWFSRHIHIFAELEKLVVQFLLSDLERNAIDFFTDRDGITFEHFKVGPLYLEPTIMSHFNFEPSDFPLDAPVVYISPSWIEIAEVLRGKNNANKREGKDSYAKLELHRLYGKQVHIDIEAGNYVQRKVYRQFKEKEEAMIKCVNVEATGILLQLLRPEPNERDRFDLIQWVAPLFKTKQYYSMIKWMSSFDTSKDFLPLLHDLSLTMVKQVKPPSNQDKETLWPVDRAWTSNELALLLVSDVKVVLRNEELPTLVACSLGLVLVCAGKKIKTTAERDLARMQLEAAFSEDIPVEIRHFFSDFLTMLFKELEFVLKGDTDKQRKGRMIESMDINIPAWMEKILTRIVARSGKSYKANSFLFLLMFSVLFARVYYRDCLMRSIDQPPRKHKLQELSNEGRRISISTNEVLTSSPLLSLLNSLYLLERSFSESLKVPSFECLGVGSFLRVASHELRHVVIEHLEPILQHFQQAIGAVDQVNFLGNGDNLLPASDEVAPKVEAYEVLSALLDTYLAESTTTSKVWNVVDLLYDLEEKMREYLVPASSSKRSSGYASISILSVVVEQEELMEKISRLSLATNDSFSDSSIVTKRKTSHVTRVDGELHVSQQLQEELLNSCRELSSTESNELEVVRKVMATLHLSEANANLLLQSNSGVRSAPRKSLFVVGSTNAQTTSTATNAHNIPDPIKHMLVEQLSKIRCGESVRKTLLWSIVKVQANVETLLDLMVLLKIDLAGKKFYVMVDEDDCFKLPTEFSAQDISLLENSILNENYHVVAAFMVSAIQGLINASQVTDCLQRMFRDMNDRLLSRVLLICLSLPQSSECVALFKYFCNRVLLSVTSKSELHRKLVTVALDQPLSCRLLLSTVCAAEGSSFSDMGINIARFGTHWFEDQQEEIPVRVAADPTTDIVPNALQQVFVSSEGASRDRKTVSNTDHAVVCIERKAFVQQLLQREFRYDEHMQKPMMQSPESLKLKKTLELLAADLYKSDVHFVMELLQNADDNTYDGHSIPTIKFVLDLPYLLVLNNEIGFQEDNIGAVCNVGGSTKKGKKGNIGQKGIGFKSVFSVSDFPEIHSNGFHIMFDRHESMIEPIWIEDTTCWPSSLDESSGMYFETCLKLKLNDSALNNMSALMNNIEDIFQGKLLLFLNKLSHMIYSHPRSHMLTEHRKFQLSNNWVSIQEMQSSSSHRGSNVHKSQEGFWFIEQCKFAPVVLRNEVELDETIVALGFAFKETERRFADQDLPLDIEDDVTSNDKQCLSIKVLRPDISPMMLPLYAFLPTEMRYFQFILQADFLLSTSREQVLENNAWNNSLLSKVPALFIDMMSEMASWCFEKDKSTDKCPRLMSIVENGYEIHLEPSDLLHYVPSESVEMPSDFKHMTRLVYAGLENVSFLQAWDGEPRSAGQLICISHLSFNPCTYFNKELFDLYISPALDYRTFAKDDDDYTLESRLSHQLGVPLFDGHVVVQAMRSLETQIAAGAIKFEVAVELITGLLLCLKEMQREVATMSKSISKGFAFRADFQSWFQILRSLHIWPTQDDKFVSLEHQTLIVEGTMGGAASSLEHMTKEQRSCLDIFTGHLPRLHDTMFECAKNVLFNGHTQLRAFLLDNLKSGGKHTGGLNIITAETVLQSIIKPAYESAAGAKEDRVTYCAFLAFLYHCEQNRRDVLTPSLKHFPFDSIIFPTLRFRNQLWEADSKFGTRKASVKRVCDEIHLGAEFTDSAVSMLQGADDERSTVVMEDWCVLDPLVTAFAFGKPANTLLHSGALSAAAIRALFNDIKSDEMNKWKEFLLKRGVVNGFGIYAPESLNTTPWHACCPTICIMLARILRIARFVRTNYNTDASIVAVAPSLCKYSDIEWAAEQDSDVVPLYLHLHSDSEATVYSVDEEAHHILWCMANIIAATLQSISTLKLQNAELVDRVFKGLNTTAWFPIDNSLYYYSSARKALVSDHEKFLLTAPCNITYPKGKKKEFILGPHIPYFPTRYESRSNVQDAYPFDTFVAASATSHPSFAFCVGLYGWMMTISGYLASSSGFVAYLVRLILQYIENEAGDALLIRKAQALFNPPDSTAILWVPDELLRGNERLESCWLEVKKKYVPGQCYSRTHISLRDVSHKLFHLRNSPVKVLKYYFDDEFCGLFTPLEICVNCKMVGGEFCCRGRDSGEDSSCSCQLSASLQTLKASKGLFKQLPDALDMLAVVRFFLAQTGKYPEHVEEFRERIDVLLAELGRCVLQSLNARGDGNPPSFPFRMLNDLKRHRQVILACFLQEEAANSALTEDKIAGVVVVDDLKLWLAASDAFKASFGMAVSILKEPLSSFDLLLATNCLRVCEETSLGSISMNGEKSVKGIWRLHHEDVSVAHTSTLALLHFVGVPLLSRTMQERWLVEECSTSKSNQYLALMERLLHVSSLFWFRALKDVSETNSTWRTMMQTSKIRPMLRNLKVKLCSKLVRVVTAAGGTVRRESFEIAEDIRLPKELLLSDTSGSTLPMHTVELLVHQDADTAAVTKVLVQVVRHWVLSEIQSSYLLTSFNPSQVQKLSIDFNALLEKYSRVRANVFSTILNSDDFQSVLEHMENDRSGLWSVPTNAEAIELLDDAAAAEKAQQDSVNDIAKDIAAMEAILRVHERNKPSKERDPSRNFRESHTGDYHYPLSPSDPSKNFHHDQENHSGDHHPLLSSGDPSRNFLHDQENHSGGDHPLLSSGDPSRNFLHDQENHSGGDHPLLSSSEPSRNFHHDQENHSGDSRLTLPRQHNRLGSGIIDLSDIEFDASHPVKKLAPEELEELNAADIPEEIYVAGDFNTNYKTGRIGEFLAFQYFLRYGADMYIQSVRWVNEHKECSRPFDVLLILQDGRELLVEVKTHTLEDGEQTSNYLCRWFVSANEIEFASQQRESYIGAMLLLRKKAAGRDASYTLESLYLLGLDVKDGLYGALMSQQAKLMLLLNPTDNSNR